MAKSDETRRSEEIRRLAALFAGCAGASGTHGVPYRDAGNPLKWLIKRVAQTLRTPPSLDLWERHVRGERPLGPIPIREDSSCSWGSVDYDVYDADLLDVVERSEASGLPLVPCRSKSGGLHLFLFLRAPEPAEDVQGALRDAAATLGLAGCEIFPKQTRILSDRNDLGNWMIAPYFGGDFDGRLKMQYGVKRTGAEMTLGEFLRVAEERRTTIEALTATLETRKSTSDNVVQMRKRGGESGKSKSDFSNGPPCLQHLAAAGFQRDGRKRSLFHMAIYFKRSDEKHWQDQVESANQLFFDPPLPSEEVAGIVRSLSKKDYEYTCKEEPMRSHCNSTLCRMRKFGVGRGGDFPEITGISRLDSEPVMWFVDVAGSRLELSTEQLQSYVKFHAACMEKGAGFQMVTQKAWMGTIAEAMTNLTVIPAPPDVGRGAKFHEVLEEFLTNRSRGERVEDLLSGRPWESVEEGRHYFTLRSLQRFMSQEGIKDMSRGQMMSRIKDLDGFSASFSVKGREVYCWWVPASCVRRLPELDVPLITREEI